MSMVKRDTHVRFDEKSDKYAKELIAYEQNRLQTTSRGRVSLSSIVKESLKKNHESIFGKQ